tara:strand:+ start:285 stop:497 length:213 start_codon:yes stop_codon:yes gene_type:complete
MNLYGLTDKEVENLTDAQREWYECAGSAMIPNDIAKTKAWKDVKMPKKVRNKPIYKGDMYSYIKAVFGDE